MTAKSVWILDEGSPGHVVQSRGLLRELGKRFPLEIQEIPIRWLFGKEWTRSAARRFLKKWFLPNGLTCGLYCRTKLPAEFPDLIVASGPHSLYLLTALGRSRRCPTILVQGTIEVRPGAVTAIVRPDEGTTREDYVTTPLLFTEITRESLDEIRESSRAALGIEPGQKVAAVFIGNSSKKIQFRDGDWDALASFLNRVWKQSGLKYLLTTSYRTGEVLEARLREKIEPGSLARAVWYASAPERVTRPFLAASDAAIVTMDSLTMMTEAASSGRPSWALCPSDRESLEQNTHTRYVEQLLHGGYLRILDVQSSDLSPGAEAFVKVPDFDGVIDDLIRRIGWSA